MLYVTGVKQTGFSCTAQHFMRMSGLCCSVLASRTMVRRGFVLCCSSAKLAAGRVCRSEGKQLGGGAMLLVFENTTHDSYNDVLALFSTRLGWFLRRVRRPLRASA